VNAKSNAKCLKFTKMHGLGNDFMVIDATSQVFDLKKEKIKSLADRHFGIGFDQLLVVEPATRPEIDFRYRIFNADGGEVEQCGNGARCFARFVQNQGLTAKSKIAVQTNTGDIVLQVSDDGLVTVDIGAPVFTPEKVPFEAEAQAQSYEIEVDGQVYTVGVVSMGNPHTVMLVEDVATAPVARLGPLIENHPRFPNRVNVGFLQVVGRGHGRLRVFERGVGETQACGTGACAAMVVGRLWGHFDASVSLALTGGDLQIQWRGEGEPVMMTGPAETVYEGEIIIEP